LGFAWIPSPLHSSSRRFIRSAPARASIPARFTNSSCLVVTKLSEMPCTSFTHTKSSQHPFSTGSTCMQVSTSAADERLRGNWAILDMLDVALAVSNASNYNLDVSQLFAMKLADCYCTELRCVIRILLL